MNIIELLLIEDKYKVGVKGILVEGVNKVPTTAIEGFGNLVRYSRLFLLSDDRAIGLEELNHFDWQPQKNEAKTKCISIQQIVKR